MMKMMRIVMMIIMMKKLLDSLSSHSVSIRAPRSFESRAAPGQTASLSLSHPFFFYFSPAHPVHQEDVLLSFLSLSLSHFLSDLFRLPVSISSSVSLSIFCLSLSTSNGGCRREEKSRKRCSLFTKFLSSVTAILFIC